ncbi:hypothetical protein VNO77_33077 [Canavalia gladiata]|uniref:Uncharacterized protein n=1 Tax=Canavalia gladiata TaxID=3824 RepID=A0AAN9KD44_CANGL
MSACLIVQIHEPSIPFLFSNIQRNDCLKFQCLTQFVIAMMLRTVLSEIISVGLGNKAGVGSFTFKTTVLPPPLLGARLVVLKLKDPVSQGSRMHEMTALASTQPFVLD